MRAFELSCPDDFDLHRSQRLIRLGTYDPCMRLDDTQVSRATRTPEGPASYTARQVGTTVSVEAWGEGAEWIESHARELLGLADDPHSFQPTDERVREWHERTPIYLARSLSLFERLVPTILQQLVTWKEAMLAWRGIVDELGEPAPGPVDLRLSPERKLLARTPYYVWSAHGVLKKRSDTIRRVAKTVGRLDPLTHTPLELARKLETASGVGPWTSHGVLASVLGYPDAVPLNDVHLPHNVAWAFAREERGSDERMLELLEPFAGNRWRVITLMRKHAKTRPRRAPRHGMQTRRRILGR